MSKYYPDTLLSKAMLKIKRMALLITEKPSVVRNEFKPHHFINHTLFWTNIITQTHLLFLKNSKILQQTFYYLNLTLSCLEISLTGVVRTFDTFERNFEIDHKFTNCLKEYCRLDF